MKIQPYKMFRPDILLTKPPTFSFDQVHEFVLTRWNLKGDLTQLDSERDQNFLMVIASGEQVVIKISNSAMDPAVLTACTQSHKFSKWIGI